MSIHSVSLKGKRPANEDRHDIIINLDEKDKSKAPINYYAVYDGHGGKFVSKFLHDHLSQCFIDKRVEYPLKKAFVKKVYEFWQNTLKTNFKINATNAGSTCLVVIQFKQNDSEYLNILNTGDCRCVINRNNIAMALTKDHKPNWPEENMRIKKLGGTVVFDGFDWRINDLSVSRAFGDITAEPFVSFMPDIFRYKLSQNDKFIILACDGLWDVMENQDVVNFILENCYDIETGSRINKHVNIAKKLAETAIMKGTTDNVSIVIVFLN
jgi:serine/threonine protein phosphatase PrpC